MYWLSALACNHALLEFSYMNSWPIRPQMLLRVTLALVTTVFPLLSFGIGGAELLLWIRYYHGTSIITSNIGLSELRGGSCWWA